MPGLATNLETGKKYSLGQGTLNGYALVARVKTSNFSKPTNPKFSQAGAQGVQEGTASKLLRHPTPRPAWLNLGLVSLLKLLVLTLATSTYPFGVPWPNEYFLPVSRLVASPGILVFFH
jgi:hypothetical protein